MESSSYLGVPTREERHALRGEDQPTSLPVVIAEDGQNDSQQNPQMISASIIPIRR
jgi:hypothetical protein